MTLEITMHDEYVKRFESYLYEQERSRNTITKYVRDVTAFLRFIQARVVNKGEVLRFKAHLVTHYAPSSVNTMLAAVNGFLDWLELPQCKVKLLKLQRDVYAKPEKTLSHSEYERLIQAAEHNGDEKLSLLLQTICSTGIRVSELEWITVSALCSARTTVRCKGKTRVILLPKALCKALKIYCKKQGIVKGAVFVTKQGKPLDRSNIWKMMKRLCKEAHVIESKVFPHNLRHLFACTYYKMEKDISRLADILGHSSMNTTRIYTMETGATHARQLERMNLLYCRCESTT